MLLALHASGIHADGVDLSADMLDRCRAKLQAAGFAPELQLAPMQHFSMGRQYNCVLVAGGSFQLLTEETDVASCLHCIREHLLPGGRLFLDVDVAEPESNAEWKVGRTATREVQGEGAIEVDTLVYSSTNTFDRKTRLSTISTRYQLSREGRHIQTVTDTIVMRVFSTEDVLTLLLHAGFAVFEVSSVQLFAAHSGSLLFGAER
jgi:cyclopropane fatty-acyl-phospholipid synthase-like methyltransferase